MYWRCTSDAIGLDRFFQRFLLQESDCPPAGSAGELHGVVGLALVGEFGEDAEQVAGSRIGRQQLPSFCRDPYSSPSSAPP